MAVAQELLELNLCNFLSRISGFDASLDKKKRELSSVTNIFLYYNLHCPKLATCFGISIKPSFLIFGCLCNGGFMEKSTNSACFEQYKVLPENVLVIASP
jgi:hypothetical protein